VASRRRIRSIRGRRTQAAEHTVDTGGWFERQLGLSIIAVMATFHSEKALGDADELSWWVNQVATAQAWLP
jgi:hypothetical protein